MKKNKCKTSGIRPPNLVIQNSPKENEQLNRTMGTRNGANVENVRWKATTREVVYMERPLEPNMGPSLANVLLCTFESTNAGFSSFPVRKLMS